MACVMTVTFSEDDPAIKHFGKLLVHGVCVCMCVHACIAIYVCVLN